MVTIVRDRIADLVKKGLTIEQVKAAKSFATTMPTTERRPASGRRRCSSKRCIGRSMRSSVLMAFVLMASMAVAAQGPPAGRGASQGAPGGRDRQPPRLPRAAASWISPATGLRRHRGLALRMVTPAKGDFAGGLPNAVARKLGQAWDPAKDAEGTSAKPTAPPESCACRDGCTSPGRTTRRSRSTPIRHADTSAELRWQARAWTQNHRGRAFRPRTGKDHSGDRGLLISCRSRSTREKARAVDRWKW